MLSTRFFLRTMNRYLFAITRVPDHQHDMTFAFQHSHEGCNN